MRFRPIVDSTDIVFSPRFVSDRITLQFLGFGIMDPRKGLQTHPVEKINYLAYTAVARSIGGQRMRRTDPILWDITQHNRTPADKRDAAFHGRAKSLDRTLNKEVKKARVRNVLVGDYDGLDLTFPARVKLAQGILDRIAAHFPDRADRPDLEVHYKPLGDSPIVPADNYPTTAPEDLLVSQRVVVGLSDLSQQEAASFGQQLPPINKFA